MRKSNTAQTAPEAVDLRQRAATSRDAAGRFIKRDARADDVDWYDPPPGFMAWPAIEPSQFVPVSEGITRELARLRGAASAEFVRRVDARATSEGEERLRRELHLDLLSKAAPSDAGILGRVDLTSASLNELHIIRDHMYALSDVAYGLATQECCRSDRNGPFDSPYNAAGALMHWLADQFTSVEDRAEVELLRRRPTDRSGRKKRLAAVAERVILSGDDDETASFISDLTAFAAEQAGR